MTLEESPKPKTLKQVISWTVTLLNFRMAFVGVTHENVEELCVLPALICQSCCFRLKMHCYQAFAYAGMRTLHTAIFPRRAEPDFNSPCFLSVFLLRPIIPECSPR